MPTPNSKPIKSWLIGFCAPCTIFNAFLSAPGDSGETKLIMLEVRPFQAYRYAKDKVGEFQNVITPPFDVIAAEREELAGKSPFNMAHLLLPKTTPERDAYANAAYLLESWIRDGVFKQDDTPSFYLLEQAFTDVDGNRHRRRAFFAAVRVPEPGERVILGHERIFQHKVDDRLALTKATRANLGAVFSLYNDPEGELEAFRSRLVEQEADMEFQTIDGVDCRVLRVDGSNAVTEFFRDRKLYIADGHHRFATACAYRDFVRRDRGDVEGPHNALLMGLVAVEDPGLMVYPAHRVLNAPQSFDSKSLLSKLAPFFEVTPVANGELQRRVYSANECTLGLAIRGDGKYLLRLKDVDREAFLGSDHGPAWRALDVAVLHRGILENALGFPAETEFTYEPDTRKALAYLEREEKDLAFILKGTPAEQILACSEANENMPQKSTYLYPKLPSGAVIRRLD